ncbi:MAG: metal-sensitive transcriptional regulator [Pseudomonadota bacterium]
MINDVTKKDALKRLRRIEGQIKGLMKMIDDEKYCIDLINQVNAMRRALEQVALIIMKRHVESCVAESIKCCDEGKKVDELIRTIDRFIR